MNITIVWMVYVKQVKSMSRVPTKKMLIKICENVTKCCMRDLLLFKIYITYSHSVLNVSLKGFAAFWEFSFYRQKRSLILNITVFAEKNHIILNFSLFMCSNLGLFTQTPAFFFRFLFIIIKMETHLFVLKIQGVH